MNEQTLEWITKSDRDFTSMLRELKAVNDPNYDDACFHAQQCIEKLLKATLLEAQLPIPKIHDLRELLTRLVDIHPEWTSYIEDAAMLTAFAVNFRYPGETADFELASSAAEICSRLRLILRNSLLGINELGFPPSEV